ncbi:hypothetical protein LIER_00240 [Lithospermum erythrorhizon]|uniref:Uncharacterized protein n=1 Tax=Lithospermum erythrorhizon TaxID=34254 RepID=A0AAV3NGS5_LITER
MQSRLALNKLVSTTTINRHLLQRSLASSGGAEGRTADPNVHATDPEDTYPEERPLGTPTKEQHPINPFVPPSPPHSPSPKLESNAINPPIDPINQQRRRVFSLKDVSCVGVDGTPWPEDEMDRRRQIDERVEDDREYYEDHKASPLAEIEVARATDGGYFGGDGVVLFRPEQLDTAEDSLTRARMMFLENATRGDPHSPHGRLLRALRGQYW